MIARSLKTKYALTALGLGAVVALLLAGVLFWQYRLDATRLSRLAYQSTEQELLDELQRAWIRDGGRARARARATHGRGGLGRRVRHRR